MPGSNLPSIFSYSQIYSCKNNPQFSPIIHQKAILFLFREPSDPFSTASEGDKNCGNVLGQRELPPHLLSGAEHTAEHRVPCLYLAPLLPYVHTI